jgi:uncharacterized alpha-E superfamily protein
MTRFTKVNYFSALDGPIAVSRELALAAILRMNGSSKTDMSEEDILHHVTFAKDNGNSVISAVISARENARSARDVISTELWESINKYYHFILDYKIEAYKKTHLFDFSQRATDMAVVIKGKVDSTLMHDATWDVIKAGLFIERAVQIIRTISVKYEDIQTLEAEDPSLAVRSHQLATLLDTLESFDMSKKYCSRTPDLTNALEFLVLNPDFPRSFLFCLQKVQFHINRLSPDKHASADSVEYFIDKNYSNMKYKVVEDLETDMSAELNNMNNLMFEIAGKIESQFLS